MTEDNQDNISRLFADSGNSAQPASQTQNTQSKPSAASAAFQGIKKTYKAMSDKQKAIGAAILSTALVVGLAYNAIRPNRSIEDHVHAAPIENTQSVRGTHPSSPSVPKTAMEAMRYGWNDLESDMNKAVRNLSNWENQYNRLRQKEVRAQERIDIAYARAKDRADGKKLDLILKTVSTGVGIGSDMHYRKSSQSRARNWQRKGERLGRDYVKLKGLEARAEALDRDIPTSDVLWTPKKINEVRTELMVLYTGNIEANEISPELKAKLQFIINTKPKYSSAGMLVGSGYSGSGLLSRLN